MYERVSRSSADEQRTSSQIRPQHRSAGLVPHQYDYEDPPPPSAIRTFRDSRRRTGTGAELMSPKAARVGARKMPPPISLALPVSVEDFPDRMHEDPSSPPMTERSAPERRSTEPTSDSSRPVIVHRPDSFLQRAFRDLPPPSSSSEASGPSSSQSHRTQVRLAGGPQPITHVLPSLQTTVVVSPPARIPSVPVPSSTGPLQRIREESRPRTGRPRMQSPARADALRRSSVPRTQVVFGDNRPLPRDRTSLPSAGTASHDLRRSRPQFVPRFTPRRDQIVLPAPLAPAFVAKNEDEGFGDQRGSPS